MLFLWEMFRIRQLIIFTESFIEKAFVLTLMIQIHLNSVCV